MPSTRTLAIAVLAALSTFSASLAAPPSETMAIPMAEAAWDFGDQPHRFAWHRARDAVYVEQGRGWIRDAELRDGTLEFDMMIQEEQAFSGVAFRAADRRNFENFYLRHHLSGKPDATQYQPVYHGNSGWQIYAGAGYTAQAEWVFGRWMHVRVDVNGDRAAVYVDSTEPVLVIDDLQRDPVAGGIALNGSNVWFADVRITPGSPEIPPAPEAESGFDAASERVLVDSWRVSGPFEEALVDGVVEVDADRLGLEGWQPLAPTHRGIANLGRTTGIADGRNTVIAATTLHADSARTARVRFGFSDRVRVYLNGRLLFTGADAYRSRDYRYLGTIGLFDEVALPLEAGDNELWLAVSEDFGGWGVTAELVPPDGVRIRE